MNLFTAIGKISRSFLLNKQMLRQINAIATKQFMSEKLSEKKKYV